MMLVVAAAGCGNVRVLVATRHYCEGEGGGGGRGKEREGFGDNKMKKVQRKGMVMKPT